MNNVVKEEKGVMRQNWGCGEGGATLTQVIRRGPLEEVSFDLTLKEGLARCSLALQDLGPVLVCLSEWVSVTRLQ